MNKLSNVYLTIIVALVLLTSTKALANEFDWQSAKLHNYKANAKFSENEQLTITLNSSKGAAVILRPSNGKTWDFSAYHGLKVSIKNISNARIMPLITLDAPNSEKWQEIDNSLYLEPQQSKTLLVYFYITAKDFAQRYPQYQKMNGGPNTQMIKWDGIDISNINKLSFSAINVRDYISAQGSYIVQHIEPFRYDQIFDNKKEIPFPFIDKYGQYLHGKYPGKLNNELDFIEREQQELDDLKAHPGPGNRSKWGGWLNGPKQKATGYFYTKQIDGKWWFVDPDGYLFWSHGVTGVGYHGANTLIAGREHYFQDLPSKHSKYQDFYSKGRGTRFDFTKANLYRKFGKNWQETTNKRNHQRLKSWGLNTFANWSDPSGFALQQTPFTIAVHYKSRMLEEKMPDPWDKDFGRNITEELKNKQRHEHGDSPWNLGFFVNNELHWMGPISYATIISNAPADQPAKIYFVDALQKKYKTIGELNDTWQTKFSSFNDILTSRNKLTFNQFKEDATWFYQQMADQYFKICRQAVKSVFPNHLYLGSRLHGDVNAMVLRAAEKHTDVISYNLYRRTIRDFTSKAKGLTKPLMATEFHFGAMDRGMFSTGLQEVSSQEERAQHYYEYVLGALNNPLFVGTHWFQYRSQALTGRGDGENYQVSLVDITDTPYPETIEAIRKIGYSLYETRANNENKNE
ncbi:beta-galactosidase [Thalassotalea nanhaiensis]|uniref:Beta-galactosidase n=1 Tax=Thalassotalea nanhaiensis TaxID=3065648 RepID=A0ABY9TK26_9GAMM|nr:beta-galactosidase [Colwelliaceae bacterium SQ345]